MSASVLSARPRKRARKLALALASIPVALVVLEFGYRAWTWIGGVAYSAASADRELEHMLSALTERVPGEKIVDSKDVAASNIATLPHPYLGYASKHLFDTIDADSTYYQTPGAERAFDVVILGGSVAANFENWAALTLVPKLASDARLSGRMIRIHGYGQGGYKEPQPLNLLVLLLAWGHKPDAVITINGFNELTVAGDNALHGVNPVSPSWFEMASVAQGGLLDPLAMDVYVEVESLRRSARQLFNTGRRWKLTSSALAGTFLLRRMTRIANQGTVTLARYRDELGRTDSTLVVRGQNFARDPESVRAQCVRTWKESVRAQQALCRARGIPYLAVMQPCLLDTGSKQLTAQEVQHGAASDVWKQAITEGYPRMRVAGQELASEGVSFLDATRVFADVKEEVYVDNCHFGETGSEYLSRAIAGPLLALIDVKGSTVKEK